MATRRVKPIKVSLKKEAHKRTYELLAVFNSYVGYAPAQVGEAVRDALEKAGFTVETLNCRES